MTTLSHMMFDIQAMFTVVRKSELRRLSPGGWKCQPEGQKEDKLIRDTSAMTSVFHLTEPVSNSGL